MLLPLNLDYKNLYIRKCKHVKCIIWKMSSNNFCFHIWICDVKHTRLTHLIWSVLSACEFVDSFLRITQNKFQTTPFASFEFQHMKNSEYNMHMKRWSVIDVFAMPNFLDNEGFFLTLTDVHTLKSKYLNMIIWSLNSN